MDSPGNPQSNRIPYIDVTGKDCTQGICSLYCPQWCYPAFPPPPPPIQFLGDDTSSPGPNLSPLLIAVIGVLAGAFLLVTYYTVISKFCRSSDPSGSEQARGVNPSADGDPSPGPDHEPWYVSTGGLDEALIRSITVCKYKRGSGMIEGTCSVCLSEFQDGESVRLLPNCTHAFHIICIDTWLMSHSNCPLCRSEVAPTGSFPVMIPLTSDAQLPESYQDSDNQIDPGTGSGSPRSSSSGLPHRGEATGNGNLAVKSRSVRISCDACNIGRTDTVIEVQHEELQAIRRSFSTGHLCQTVADILKADQINEEDQTRDPTGSSTNHDAGSVKNYSGVCKIGHRRNFPHGVIDWPVPMKLSSTSGRLSHSRHERAKGVSVRFPVQELPVQIEKPCK